MVKSVRLVYFVDARLKLVKLSNIHLSLDKPASLTHASNYIMSDWDDSRALG